jgi:hypothetical protein
MENFDVEPTIVMKEIGVYELFTYSQAFKWFRDSHNLFHEIRVDRTLEPKFCYEIHWWAFDKENFPFGSEWKNVTDRDEFFLYYKYEEAELECIKKMIEIVKDKNI